MTKSDLKPFYLVECRNGYRYIVALDETDKLMFVRNYGYMPLSDYNNDLTDIDGLAEYDITKVYGRSNNKNNAISLETANRTLLWEREEQKEMTLAEIEAELGYKIKIVG